MRNWFHIGRVYGIIKLRGEVMNKQEQELILRDRAFCQEAGKIGHKGWEKYMVKDCLMGTKLHEPYIKGKVKIGKIMEFTYALNQLSFTWEPEYAFCSEDGTLGVTTGMYQRTYLLEDEMIKEIGKYVTTWTKQKGEWFVVFDMGN